MAPKAFSTSGNKLWILPATQWSRYTSNRVPIKLSPFKWRQRNGVECPNAFSHSTMHIVECSARSMIYEYSVSCTCWRHHRTFTPHCSWHRRWCRRRRRNTLTLAMMAKTLFYRHTHTHTISARAVWTLVARRSSCLRSRFVIEITV